MSCWRLQRKSPPTRIAANWTCCSVPVNASRWRSSRWPSASWAAMPSASPAASRASSPTTGTSTRESSRSGRSASRTSSPAATSLSSRDIRASRIAARSRRLAAAEAIRPRWPWQRRLVRNTVRSARTWMACTPPTRGWSPWHAASTRCRTRRRRSSPSPAPRCSTRRQSSSRRRKGLRSMRARRRRRCRAPTRRRTGPSCADIRRDCREPWWASPASATSFCSTPPCRPARRSSCSTRTRLPESSSTRAATDT